jgi:hypothetical protein
MKKTFLFLICKNRNKKDAITGIKITKNNKQINFNKEECREIYLYLRMHHRIWVK